MAIKFAPKTASDAPVAAPKSQAPQPAASSSEADAATDRAAKPTRAKGKKPTKPPAEKESDLF